VYWDVFGSAVAATVHVGPYAGRRQMIFDLESSRI
jgi:hypothetical protein